MLDQEPILRSEKLQRGLSAAGWLSLTPSRLVFTKKQELTSGVLWQISLEQLHSVRAKKAFAKGQDHLEVYYLDEGGKNQKTTFIRTSWAQLANPVGRVESNSLA